MIVLICSNLVLIYWMIFVLVISLVIVVKLIFFFLHQQPLNDDGELVYCLPRVHPSNALYNPYDLQVVSTSKAKQSEEFWIVTASFVSKVILNGCSQHSEQQNIAELRT